MHRSNGEAEDMRGLFKKFCYERLSIRKNYVCLTDFVLNKVIGI